MWQWFDGVNITCGGALSGTMGVPGVAGPMGQDASVSGKMPLHSVHKVGIRALLFLRSGLEGYKEGVT